jgi:transcriptional regulator GlxA family with amidase domain
MKTTRLNNLPGRFGFLLINDFTLISLSSAIEPLRMANRICGENDYRWKTLSMTGKPVLASDGLSINVDCGSVVAGVWKKTPANHCPYGCGRSISRV